MTWREKVNPLKSGTKQGCPMSPYRFYKVIEVLPRAIGKQKKRIKRIQIGKEKVKYLLFADTMIVCRRDLKTSTGELLQVINTYINVAGYKINSKKNQAPSMLYMSIINITEPTSHMTRAYGK